MADPVPAVTYAAVFAAYSAIITGGTVTFLTVAECRDVEDFFTGDCTNSLSDLLRAVATGTIPGAPFEVNVLFGTVSLAARLVIIVWLFEKATWAGIVGLVVGVISALVAFLT